MKLCIPVEANEGLDTPVYGHFGSAPLFVVVDTDTREIREVANRDLHHAHGGCSPIKAMGGEAVDAVLVGGIGGGALRGLNQAGFKVYRAGGATIAENLAMMALGELSELSPDQVCGGHGSSCGH